MDNGRWSFGLLDILYWDERGWIKIRVRPISATIKEMEEPVGAIEEEEGVLNTFKIINPCNKQFSGRWKVWGHHEFCSIVDEGSVLFTYKLVKSIFQHVIWVGEIWRLGIGCRKYTSDKYSGCSCNKIFWIKLGFSIYALLKYYSKYYF